VATVAGVDRSVVSRVINRDPGLKIRPETQQRILAAVRDMGYVANTAARSLRTAESRTMGLVIPDYSNPVYGEIIRGAEAAAREADQLLLTGSVDQANDHVEDFFQVVGHGRVDRLLIAGIRLSRATIARLEESKVPWLLMNSQQPGVPWTVALDDRRAAALAVTHLHGLGHRRIAHLRGPARSDTARRREDGYRLAMAAQEIEVDPALVRPAGYSAPEGRQAMQVLLESGVEVTAIFAGNLSSALGAIHEAERQGVNVPKDLSVVGIHDLELADYLLPPLTTVRMPLFELGHRGAELLLTHDGGNRVSEVIREPLELVARGSTAKCARAKAARRGGEKGRGL
jgi:LacI family transcriptional regulator